MAVRPNAAHELARSRERLGLDDVDLYLSRRPMPWTDIRGGHGLEALHARDLARAIGVSNDETDRLARLLGGARPPAVNQVQFSPVHVRRRVLEFCSDRGIALEGHSPLDHDRALAHPVVAAIAQRPNRQPAQIMLR